MKKKEIDAEMAKKTDGSVPETEWIPIVFNIDANFFIPAYITIFSLLYNYKGTCRLMIYLLVPDDFPEHILQLLDRLKPEYPLFEYVAIHMDSRYNSIRFPSPRYSNAALFRLSIPKLLNKIDKCIYLDSDIVIEGDVSELYDIDIKDAYIAGVRDTRIVYQNDPAYRERILIPSLDHYINSGVLVMNLRKIREDRIDEQLEQAAGRDLVYIDQDVLNTVCYEKIRLLSFRFNTAVPLVYYRHSDYSIGIAVHGAEEFWEAKKHPVVVHYLDDKKPWSYRNMYGMQHWWKYVKMQNEETLKTYIKPFVRIHKVPIKTKCKEIIVFCLVKTRLFPMFKWMKKTFVMMCPFKNGEKQF